MEKIDEKTWDEIQWKTLTICWTEGHETEYKASNIIFEGVWIIFFDVVEKRIRSFPSHRIKGIMST